MAIDRISANGADDDRAMKLLAELRGYVGPAERSRWSAIIRPADVLLPVHIRTSELELRLFSTIMTLGTPQDVTLQELRTETFFPADAASETVWRQLVAANDLWTAVPAGKTIKIGVREG